MIYQLTSQVTGVTGEGIHWSTSSPHKLQVWQVRGSNDLPAHLTSYRCDRWEDPMIYQLTSQVTGVTGEGIHWSTSSPHKLQVWQVRGSTDLPAHLTSYRCDRWGDPMIYQLTSQVTGEGIQWSTSSPHKLQVWQVRGSNDLPAHLTSYRCDRWGDPMIYQLTSQVTGVTGEGIQWSTSSPHKLQVWQVRGSTDLPAHLTSYRCDRWEDPVIYQLTSQVTGVTGEGIQWSTSSPHKLQVWQVRGSNDLPAHLTSYRCDRWGDPMIYRCGPPTGGGIIYFPAFSCLILDCKA